MSSGLSGIGLTGIGLLTGFTAGIVSFLSPCMLPLVPGYVYCVAGERLAGAGGIVILLGLFMMGLVQVVHRRDPPGGPENAIGLGQSSRRGCVIAKVPRPG